MNDTQNPLSTTRFHVVEKAVREVKIKGATTLKTTRSHDSEFDDEQEIRTIRVVLALPQPLNGIMITIKLK